MGYGLGRSPFLPPSDFKIGDSSKMRMGDEVFTIGYPAYWLLGKNPKYTKGEVNALSGINDDPRVFRVIEKTLFFGSLRRSDLDTVSAVGLICIDDIFILRARSWKDSKIT